MPVDLARSFGLSGGEILTEAQENGITLWQKLNITPDIRINPVEQLGGWKFDIHHSYDPHSNNYEYDQKCCM
jgi:hypothetical protein